MKREATRKPTKRTHFQAAPGTCLDCAGDNEGRLKRLPGVLQAHIMSAAGVAVVDHDQRVTVQHQTGGD